MISLVKNRTVGVEHLFMLVLKFSSVNPFIQCTNLLFYDAIRKHIVEQHDDVHVLFLNVVLFLFLSLY